MAHVTWHGAARDPQRILTRALERGGADSALPSSFLLISFEVFVRSPWFFQYLPKNKRRTFWCKNGRLVDFVGSIFKPPKSALPSLCYDGGVLAPPPPPPPQRLTGPALRRPVVGGGGGRALEVRRPSGWGRRRPVKVADIRERWPGGPSSGGYRPGGRRRAPGQWRRPVMSRWSLRKLLFTSGPKLLTLGQILWHYAERAFHGLSYVRSGFILAIMGIALDRSKWRSVNSPKIAIIF